MKTLVILAGGKSRRMGKDKAFLPLPDKTSFLECLYQKAAQHFTRILISAAGKEQEQKIKQLLPQAEIVLDTYQGLGPIGGLVSVYEQTGCDKFAVVPVDVPYADMEVLSFFWDRCDAEAAVLQSADGCIEPLLAAYGRSVLLRMKASMEKGEYRIRSAFSSQVQLFTFADIQRELPQKAQADLPSMFGNINTEQDYKGILL